MSGFLRHNWHCDWKKMCGFVEICLINCIAVWYPSFIKHADFFFIEREKTVVFVSLAYISI